LNNGFHNTHPSRQIQTRKTLSRAGFLKIRISTTQPGVYYNLQRPAIPAVDQRTCKKITKIHRANDDHSRQKASTKQPGLHGNGTPQWFLQARMASDDSTVPATRSEIQGWVEFYLLQFCSMM
jgi:hypothetical protein